MKTLYEILDYKVGKTLSNIGVITLPVEMEEIFNFSNINDPLQFYVKTSGSKYDATVTHRSSNRRGKQEQEKYIEFRCSGLINEFEIGNIINIYLIEKGRDKFFEITTKKLKTKKKSINILNFNEEEFPEGKETFKLHKKRERNSKLIRRAKSRFLEKEGELYCEICSFNFRKKYGKIGKKFIEAHHTKPVSELTEGETTKISDIIMVCSNCHRMIHRKRPWLKKKDLRKLLKG